MKSIYLLLIVVLTLFIGCSLDKKITPIFENITPSKGSNIYSLNWQQTLKTEGLIEDELKFSSETIINFKRCSLGNVVGFFPNRNWKDVNNWCNGYNSYTKPDYLTYYISKEEIKFEVKSINVISRTYQKRNKVNGKLRNKTIQDSLKYLITNRSSKIDTFTVIGEGELVDNPNNEIYIERSIKGIIRDSMTIIKIDTGIDSIKINEFLNFVDEGQYKLTSPKNLIDTIYLN